MINKSHFENSLSPCTTITENDSCYLKSKVFELFEFLHDVRSDPVRGRLIVLGLDIGTCKNTSKCKPDVYEISTKLKVFHAVINPKSSFQNKQFLTSQKSVSYTLQTDSTVVLFNPVLFLTSSITA